LIKSGFTSDLESFFRIWVYLDIELQEDETALEINKFKADSPTNKK
jgi:hypothetical protein